MKGPCSQRRFQERFGIWILWKLVRVPHMFRGLGPTASASILSREKLLTLCVLSLHRIINLTYFLLHQKLSFDPSKHPEFSDLVIFPRVFQGCHPSK